MITKDLGNKEIMADNLQKQLDKRGMTVADLSEALNFKYSTVRDWIKGNTYPRIDKIEMMANYFNISKSDLVERKTDREEPKTIDFVKELSADDIDWSWASAGGKPISERAKANILAAFYDEIQEYKKNHPNND
ncbi:MULTISPECIES: helix-turn-helix transcriptional regulator [unclassified Lactococcus]|jgi:transcriptional regulator with XRE-family HTH domain|uniref:helix-turn-helix domain-containing protein n=1 Tax=unclassified Lactococcus TaxID=2643510 RepID=UPI0014306388|nr:MULTISPECIES: helix-turn-helix transcriptional regulator [unclassified Lactococcus]KAF6606822.1 helix-turn-helix transcriptional regulator [Lactococcus sp. EKM201L]KAF6611521.1 helix-turn-helix transcriptional regulator [Lactococcus sp. EKM203L]KAF6640121.1 helix-turn-helix transcriptional regulator [Lactococcus sp. EKM501L]KAF6642433.1 helix-turn-helix transcriptional regulator [Lactococcus sp. EKM502L]KAF6650714.1 helix-turn-helix transcriptional regulator [Lactococcus sp. EKM101L]